MAVLKTRLLVGMILGGMILGGLGLPAHANSLDCTIGQGDAVTRLSLSVPDGRRLPRSERLDLAVAGSDGQALDAIAAHVPAAESPTGRPFIRVIFQIDAALAMSLNIDRTGDSMALAYVMETREHIPDSRQLGYCNNSVALFDRWR